MTSGGDAFDAPRAERVGALATIGGVIVGLNLAVAVLGPFIAGHGAGAIVADRPFEGASWSLPLGADHIGRDVLSQLLHAAPVTLGVALVATVLGFLLGVPFGFLASETRGAADRLVTWLLDVLVSFPPKLVALIAIAGAGSSIPVLVVTLGLLHAPRVARVARAIAQNISALEFVEAARARGESLQAIMLREIWPSARRPLAVEFGLRVTFSILIVSSLSFLGLGVQPPLTDWGSMVRENMAGIFLGNAAALIPAFAIGVLTVGINLVIDGIGGGSRQRAAEGLDR